MKTLLLASLLVVFLAPVAQAQRPPRFGVEGGVFFPSSARTKRVFGSTFSSFGPGFGDVRVPKRKLYSDLDLLRQRDDGNRAFVVFAGGKLLFPLGKAPGAGTRFGFAPYGGFGLNLTYANIDAPAANVDDGGFGVGASAILGASLGRTFFGEARYRATSSTAGFNFSGAQVVLGVRF
ncbi:MAG TPA: outer membrane beta-barrel protein [Abditibacterium sp.]|jgi:hypothetical protein